MKNQMKVLLMGAVLACAGLSSVCAEASPAVLTVDQAVEAALKNNIAVKSAAVQERIKKRANDFSFNNFYPTISGTATALRGNETSTYLYPLSSGPTEVLPIVLDKNTVALGLTVQQVFSPAYLGLINQVSIDYQGSVIGREKAKSQITAAVKKFYYQLIVQKEAIDLTRARLENAKERLRQAQVSYELGQGTELNYMYAKANVDGLIPDLRSMETSRVMALTKFQEILGFEKRDDMELSGSLDEETVPTEDKLKVEGSRFDVNESLLTVKQLKNALRIQDLTLLPNLILQYKADPAINGPTASTLFDSGNWSQSSGGFYVTLSWEISGFLPGSAFQIKRAALKDQLALANESARTTVINASHDEENQRRLIGDSLAKIENLKSVVVSTKRAYELTDISYKAGAGRYLDLQAAELSWQSTQIQLLNEQLNLMSLVYDFESKYMSSE